MLYKETYDRKIRDIKNSCISGKTEGRKIEKINETLVYLAQTENEKIISGKIGGAHLFQGVCNLSVHHL